MANISSSTRVPSIEKLIEIALGMGDKSLRAKADKALLAIGKPALAYIIAGLQRNPPVSNASREAADLLGRMGDPQAVAPLAAVMHSASIYGRGDYVTALGRIGGEPAAKALAEALQYEDTRMAAARWLERIGEAAVAPLITLLGDENVRSTAARVLVKIGAPAVEPLNNVLNDPDPTVRKAAVGALKKLTANKDLEKRKVSDKGNKSDIPKEKKDIHRGINLMTPRRREIKALYSFIAASKMLNLADAEDAKLAGLIFQYAFQEINNKDPESRKLLSQVEKQKTLHIQNTGMAKSEKDLAYAFSEWMKTKGIDISDTKREKKITLFPGSVKNQQDGSLINWCVFLYFDFGN